MIIVWERPNNTHYIRHVKGFYKNYYVGYMNQYNHKVLFVIRLRDYIQYDNRFKMFLKRNILRLYKKI